MGMFTSIDHPDDGRELQIKTGQDQCRRYKIGDTIPWTPNPYYPGEHIDGAHDSWGTKGQDCWVIIKGCVVVAVEPFTGNDDPKRLEEKYGITPPDPALWTPEQWAEVARRKADFEARYAEFLKKHNGDALAASGDMFITAKLKECSFTQALFPVTPTT
jgi:hypothetical protein